VTGDPALASARTDGAAIEGCITRLVREAPVVDGAVATELIERLRAVGVPLALSIARIVELIADDLVAPGVALPHLAMACATLADGVAGRLSERELEAARYEVDTLLPVPDAPGRQHDRAGPEEPQSGGPREVYDRRVHVRVPDVPLGALTRGPRRRT